MWAFLTLLKDPFMTNIITANTGDNSTSRAEILLPIDGVLPQVHMGRSSWLNGVKAGKYHAPVFLSPRRPVWKQSSIDALISAL